MMHMTFYWGKNVTILFDFWRTKTYTDYFVSILACFLFSLFYQYLEHRRIAFKTLANSKIVSSSSQEETPLLSSGKIYSNFGLRWKRIIGSILFGVNSALGYMLMLAIMSFNWGVFIAIVLGLSVGYFLFRSSEDETIAVDNPCACA